MSDMTKHNATLSDLHAEPEGVGASVELFFDGQSYHCMACNEAFLLGRDVACAIKVQSDLVSRKHCFIIYRDDKFVLVDQSTNGTYVQFGRARPVRLHQESMPLIGTGVIKLGSSLSLGDADLIHFKVQG